MENLVKYIDKTYSNLKMKFVFSTPSEYIKAIKKEKMKYPVFYGDLLPYAEDNNEVFSGFFTSRPSLKK